TYNAKTYAILTAGSISGNFATVSGTPAAGVTQAIAATSNEVDLVLTGSGTGSGSSTTGGAIVVTPGNATPLTHLSTVALNAGQQATSTLFDHLMEGQTGNDGDRLAGTAPVQLAAAGSSSQLGGLLAALPDGARRLWRLGARHRQLQLAPEQRRGARRRQPDRRLPRRPRPSGDGPAHPRSRPRLRSHQHAKQGRPRPRHHRDA